MRFNTRVEALDSQDKHYRVTANGVCFEADEVVIATGRIRRAEGTVHGPAS